MSNSSEETLPWYKEGLRFKCTGCGGCCTGSPGYVWVSEEEIVRLSEFLKLSQEEFVRKYTHVLYGRISLKELPRSHYDCVFLEGKRCSVYSVRPKQCRTFPWWKDALSSPQAWQETAARCEGIDHADAPLISITEIQQHLE